MLKIIRIILFPLLIIIFSCEDKGFIVRCSDCTAEEPVSTDLTAQLDPDHYTSAVISIWDGNLEDSLLITSFPAYGETVSEEVVLNKKYTITAAYTLGGSEVIAVDSATPHVKYEKSQCDEPCYFIYDKKVNLKLHYNP
jgi:hypothetical protein